MDGAKIESLVKGKVTYQKLVAEEEESMSFKEFQLMEAEGGKEKHTATYIFADGMVPVGGGGSDPLEESQNQGSANRKRSAGRHHFSDIQSRERRHGLPRLLWRRICAIIILWAVCISVRID